MFNFKRQKRNNKTVLLWETNTVRNISCPFWWGGYPSSGHGVSQSCLQRGTHVLAGGTSVLAGGTPVQARGYPGPGPGKTWDQRLGCHLGPDTGVPLERTWDNGLGRDLAGVPKKGHGTRGLEMTQDQSRFTLPC